MVYEYFNINGKELKLDAYLVKKLNNVKKLIRKQWDCFFIVDGMERSGKSTLGLSCAWYLSNGKITLNNLCKDLDDAIDKIKNLPDKSILFVDEASLLFTGGDATTRWQKKLMKILNVVGQKQMVFILVLPNWFELKRDIAVRRAKFLLHVYMDGTLQRGKFAYFGDKRKKLLYDKGKKNLSYSYPKANFTGKYEDFMPFDGKYKDLKKDTLLGLLKGEDTHNPKELKRMFITESMKRMKSLESKHKLSVRDKATIFGCSLDTINRYSKELRGLDVRSE